MMIAKLKRQVAKGAIKSGSRGFTLLEIMVVVIILGTIAGLVGVRVMDRLEQSKIETAKIQMSSLKQALDLFKLDNGFYPTTEMSLQSLVAPPSIGRIPMNYRPGGYLNDNKVPLDPWGLPYGFISDGFSYVIFSAGPDGRENTEDDIRG